MLEFHREFKISLNYFLLTLISDIIFPVIEVMKQINDIKIDTNVLSLRKACLRKVINLIDSTMDYKELVEKIVKYSQVDMDLINMIIDCCCEHSIYRHHFGHLTKVKI